VLTHGLAERESFDSRHKKNDEHKGEGGIVGEKIFLE
jgi:hypothetical protein